VSFSFFSPFPLQTGSNSPPPPPTHPPPLFPLPSLQRSFLSSANRDGFLPSLTKAYSRDPPRPRISCLENRSPLFLNITTFGWQEPWPPREYAFRVGSPASRCTFRLSWTYEILFSQRFPFSCKSECDSFFKGPPSFLPDTFKFSVVVMRDTSLCPPYPRSSTRYFPRLAVQTLCSLLIRPHYDCPIRVTYFGHPCCDPNLSSFISLPL